MPISTPGWRTVTVQDHGKLFLRDGQMVMAAGETETCLPIQQLSGLMIMCPDGSITLPLMNELLRQQVSVIVCDEKRTPAGELIGISQNGGAAGCLMDQAAWSAERKLAVWAAIVRQKIRMQIEALRRLKLPVPDEMYVYLDNVAPGDITNREGQAARLYFNTLFGTEFIRQAPDDINAGLDYGYAILRSAFSRAVTMNGYHTALGIHHCGRLNPVNLSCDLMEPFRPFCDLTVYANRRSTLTWEYKKELISLPHVCCMYRGKETRLQNAVDCFTLDVLKAMSDAEHTIGEVSLAG